MDPFVQNLRVSIRSLARHRGFTVVTVLTLALGVGATTAIFSVVYGVLLRPLPYVEADRLVTFGQTSRRSPQEPVSGSSSHVNFRDWQGSATTIQEMALYTGGRAVISNQAEAEVVPIAFVTPGFFSVFKAAPILGRGFTEDENLPNGPRAVVISYGFWQERFGGRPDVLSQSVEISGVPWPVVGVAPEGFDFPNRARLWRPVRNDDEQCGRGCVYLNGIGRLADGASPAQAQEEMAAIAAALERAFPNDNTDVTVMVQTLRDRLVGNVRPALVVLLGAVALVLLIACANVANLVLVRGASRQTEIAVRTALGSGRRGVVAYLLTENLVLAAAGGICGLVVAVWGVDALKAMAPASLPRLDDVQFDGVTFLFALGMVVVTTILFGLGPSLQLARVPLAQAIGQRGSVGVSGRSWSRSALLLAEVSLSAVLLLGAGLLLRSLYALQATDPGFDPANITTFTVSLPAAHYPDEHVVQTHEQIDEAIAALPGVTSVARVSDVPLGPGENVLTFVRPDRPPPPTGQVPVALYNVVDSEYFDTLRVPVLAGRDFSPGDRAGAQRVVVISERMARTFWPGEDPVGRPISIGDQGPAIVAGVVGNVRSQTLAREADPQMYVPHAQVRNRTMTYVVQSSLDPAQVVAGARQVVQRFDRRLPLIAAGSLQSLVDNQLARPRFYLVLIGVFAVLAVSLAVVGIYGVVAHVVHERTREIGVRIALGASRRQVVGLMIWQGLRPGVSGVAIGLALALAAGRIIEGLLYEVTAHDLLTYAGVTAVLLLVVLVSSAVPAARASRLPPAAALRAE
jgi:putative ABC transport system permease protein